MPDLINLLRLDPRYKPPKQSAMNSAKSYHETERKMFAIVIELVRYVIFMYLVLLVAYLKKDQNIFPLNDALQKTIFENTSFQTVEYI